MAVAIVRAREIIERSEQGAREKAGSCEVEVLNYLEAIKKSELSKSTITSRCYVLTSLIEHLGVKSPTSITRSALQRWFDKHRERNPHTACRHETLDIADYNGREAMVNAVRQWMTRLPYVNLFVPRLVKIDKELERCSREAENTA